MGKQLSSSTSQVSLGMALAVPTFSEACLDLFTLDGSLSPLQAFSVFDLIQPLAHRMGLHDAMTTSWRGRLAQRGIDTTLTAQLVRSPILNTSFERVS